jgi:hypothetical protein
MLFKKRRGKSNERPMQDKAAKGIAKFLLSIQMSFTNLMNGITKNMSIKSVKILLILFCLFGGGFSIYLVAAAILRPDSRQPELKIDRVNVPKYYDKSGNETLQSDQYVDQETYHQIQEYELFMDSLGKTQSGLGLRDSILLTRPGLADSIKMLKEIYQSQIK